MKFLLGTIADRKSKFENVRNDILGWHQIAWKNISEQLYAGFEISENVESWYNFHSWPLET